MREIKTNDGSITFLNEDINEFYNPLTGAIDRAFNAYINKIDYSNKNELKVLDIGLGLGYNSLCLTYECLKRNINVEIVAVDKDIGAINMIPRLNIPDYLVYSHSLLLEGIKSKRTEHKNFRFRLETGNILDIADKLKEKFDIIILDPFSYSKNKEMYSSNLLIKLKKLFNKYGFLICYNSNPVFVSNLLENSFFIKKYEISKHEHGIMASPFLKFELDDSSKKLARAFGKDINP